MLAGVLTGEPRSVRRRAARVARLRATGLDVAVLGDPERTDGEVVEMTNPVVGTHRKLVVRDGVIVGRHPGRRPVPGRPDHPALRPRARCSAGTSPASCCSERRPRRAARRRSPDDAEVCACAGVTAGPDPGLRLARRGPRAPPAPPPAAAAAPDRRASCSPTRPLDALLRRRHRWHEPRRSPQDSWSSSATAWSATASCRPRSSAASPRPTTSWSSARSRVRRTTGSR